MFWYKFPGSMDCIFGIQGKDFVILVADGSVEYSIVRFKDDEDKIITIDDNKLIASTGAQGERTQLMDYLQKNMHLYRLRHGFKLSTHAAASFTRSEMARFLRSNPFQVNMLLAGVDEIKGPGLYYLDYLASIQKVTRAAHGYGAYFILGLMDKYWKKDLSEDEGMEIVKMCIREIQTRFLMNKKMFTVKIVKKGEAIRVINLGI